MKQSLASEVAKARQHIKQSLECVSSLEVHCNLVDVVNVSLAYTSACTEHDHFTF